MRIVLIERVVKQWAIETQRRGAYDGIEVVAESEPLSRQVIYEFKRPDRLSEDEKEAILEELRAGLEKEEDGTIEETL